MTGDPNLSHILRLLDDDSPAVRRRVWDTLESNLPAWEGGIREKLPALPEGVRKRLGDLLAGRARRGFRGAWLRWRELPGDMARLEAALSGLSWFLAEDRAGRKRSGDGAAPAHRDRRSPAGGMPGLPGHPALAPLLDGLARDFQDRVQVPTPSALASFLFSERGLAGAENDYYNPDNSDLVRVIERGRGIPISLACVFMLVGNRLGLPIYGCDVPEHFLTRAPEGGLELIIDCFDRGRILEGERLAQLERKYAPGFSRLLREPAPPEAIVARVLRNLINAFHLAGDRQGSQFMYDLAEDLRGGPERLRSGERNDGHGSAGGGADAEADPEAPWDGEDPD